MNAHQHRQVARILRYVSLGDIDSLQAVCDSSDSVEVWDLAAELDARAALIELNIAGPLVGLAGSGGTGRENPSHASVVAFPVAPGRDVTPGASTACMFGTPWCPDKDGRVCADCAEFSSRGDAA